MTIISTSPLAAPIKIVNFSHTPCNMPNRLLFASVFKKFLTISPTSAPPPVCRCNSWIILDLSSELRVGAFRMIGSLESLLKTSESAARALEVLSREDDLAAAVYCNKIRFLRKSSNFRDRICYKAPMIRQLPENMNHLPGHLHRSHPGRKELLEA